MFHSVIIQTTWKVKLIVINKFGTDTARYERLSFISSTTDNVFGDIVQWSYISHIIMTGPRGLGYSVVGILCVLDWTNLVSIP